MADTFMYFKKLEAAGFTRKQVEAQLEVVMDFSQSNLATRDDLNGLRTELKAEMQDLRAEMKDIRAELKADIQDIRTEMKDLRTEFEARFVRLETEISRMGDRLTIRLGGMMIVGFGAMAALIKLT